MAVNVLLPLLIPLGEQITNVPLVPTEYTIDEETQEENSLSFSSNVSNHDYRSGKGTSNLFFSKVTYTTRVKENVAPVHLVTVIAFSKAPAGPIRYILVGGDDHGVFTTDHTTGQVNLTKPLDYEIKSHYELLLGAQAGHERAFARVLVEVDDVNDNAPTFSRPLYETQMTEEDDRYLPKSILMVTATDRDVTDKYRLQYYLSGDGVTTSPYPTEHSRSTATFPMPEEDIDYEGVHLLQATYKRGKPPHLSTFSSFFSINSTSGKIRLLHPLDRDPPKGRARWVLTIGVTDGIHDASTKLHLNVKDINDNAPFFQNELMEGSVSENAPAGSEVLTVEAVDLDDPGEGTHANITFTLEKNVIDETSGRPLFTINRHTGRITTALCCLDREKSPSFAIQVVATDGGGLKGSGSVTVYIRDENDVGPKFGVKEWRVSVHEGARLNQSLARITIKDPDLSNKFQFMIVPKSGFGWDKFILVPSYPSAGSLRALKPLDYEDPEQQKGFRFMVKVTDQTIVGLSTPLQWLPNGVELYPGTDVNNWRTVSPNGFLIFDLPVLTLWSIVCVVAD